MSVHASGYNCTKCAHTRATRSWALVKKSLDANAPPPPRTHTTRETQATVYIQTNVVSVQSLARCQTGMTRLSSESESGVSSSHVGPKWNKSTSYQMEMFAPMIPHGGSRSSVALHDLPRAPHVAARCVSHEPMQPRACLGMCFAPVAVTIRCIWVQHDESELARRCASRVVCRVPGHVGRRREKRNYTCQLQPVP